MLARVHELIDKNFDEQVTDTQKLLRMRSVYDESACSQEFPLGENLAECLDAFLSIALEKGFSVENIDNTVGYAEIGSGKKIIGVLGHLDTVPEGAPESWVSPALAADIVDGKLYARGAMDDKGPLMANLYAMSALKEAGVTFNKRVRLIAGLDEETKFRCVKRYLETEETPFFSFSPDAEFAVVNGEKGILQFAIKRSFSSAVPEPVKLLGITAGDRPNVVPASAKAYFDGKTEKIKIALDELALPDISVSYVDDYLEVCASGVSTHAKNPEKGKNALQILFAALAKLEFAPVDLMMWVRDFNSLFKNESDGTSAGIACSDEISGLLTINPAVIRYKNKELTMKFDIRYPISLSEEDAEKKAQKISQRLGALHQTISHKKSLYVPADSPEVKTLVSSYEAVTHEKGEAFTIGGGTYCRAFPNSVSFGPKFPDEEDTIHQANECVSLGSLRKMTHIYAEAIFRLDRLP